MSEKQNPESAPAAHQETPEPHLAALLNAAHAKLLGAYAECNEDIDPRILDALDLIGKALRGAPARAAEWQPPEVTRVEVIDETGRVFTRWNCSTVLSFQDGGRTLKVFISPPGALAGDSNSKT